MNESIHDEPSFWVVTESAMFLTDVMEWFSHPLRLGGYCRVRRQVARRSLGKPSFSLGGY